MEIMNVGISDAPILLVLGGIIFILLALAKISKDNEGNITIEAIKGRERYLVLAGGALLIFGIFLFLLSPGQEPKPTEVQTSSPTEVQTSSPTEVQTSTPIQTTEAVTSYIPTSKNVSIPTPIDISQYYEWDFTPASEQQLNQVNVPEGYSHIIVTIYIKNNGPKTISTNPSCWKFISDGVSYSYDNVNTDLIPLFKDIKPGEEATVQIVYLVEGAPTTGSLSYSCPEVNS